MAERIYYEDKTANQTSTLPIVKKWTPENANAVKDTINSHAGEIETLEEDTDPTPETLSVLPTMNILSNKRYVVNQSGAVDVPTITGISIGYKYWELLINGDSTNTITWSEALTLKGDALDHTKANNIILAWNNGGLRNASNTISEIGALTPTAPIITGAVVTGADPDQEIITFAETPTAGTMTGFSHNGALSDVTIISIISQVANVWTVQLSRSVVNGETGSLLWTGSDIENTGVFLVDGSEVVDNQTAGVTANLISARVEDATPSVITLNLDDTPTSTAFTGISFDGALSDVTIVSLSSTSNNIIKYNLSRSILTSEVGNIVLSSALIAVDTTKLVVNNVGVFDISTLTPEWHFESWDINADGLNPVTGSNITTITNKGTGNDATINVVGSPVALSNESLVFGGDSAYDVLTGVEAQPYTFVIALDIDTLSLNNYEIFASKDTGNRSFVRVNTSDNVMCWADSLSVISSDSILDVNTHIITVVMNAGSSKVRIDQGAYTTGTAGSSGFTNFTFGASEFTVISNALIGKIRALVVKKGVVSDVNLDNIYDSITNNLI